MSRQALTTPNDAYLAGCDLALRMAALTHDWQHEWHALAGRRIERDRDAVRDLQQALTVTTEWSAFGEAARQVMRDYTIATVAIWQDATELCMRGQFESASAWRDWVAAFELGITEAVDAGGGAAAVRRLDGSHAAQEHDHAR
ncbi:hypothetical protein BLA17378_07840 [Burkholderia aenigmatica]|uniref:Phasin domain-containing protein n=1 Tax=Burkholderia aenigmatica TaxID=2015348 RepID=A0ABY6Y572_9BURK|nr:MULTISPECIES: hypothetical protein [Burkholderia]VWD38220.1 hypothetical protein BLA17378_07840 [Burkholderia aenigmatica]VWD65042.1 hypothetical protein BLA18628_07850 [Burkholderia aenigmatica]